MPFIHILLAVGHATNLFRVTQQAVPSYMSPPSLIPPRYCTCPVRLAIKSGSSRQPWYPSLSPTPKFGYPPLRQQHTGPWRRKTTSTLFIVSVCAAFLPGSQALNFLKLRYFR